MGSAEHMGQSKGLVYRARITAWVLALLWSTACPAIASESELREIRFEKGKDGEEEVLFVLNGDSPQSLLPLRGKNHG